MADHPQTIWFESALLEAGWARNVRVSVQDGVIARVAADVERDAGEQAHGPAFPGLPNLHSHAFQRGMAGFAEVRGPLADSFWTWRDVMYRFTERLRPDELRAIAALVAAHRDEFDEFIAGLANTTSLDAVRRDRRRRADR